MEGKLWYAVQEDPTDDWGKGSYNKDEAVEMMMSNDQYNLIAVIDNGCCVEEIHKSDIASETRYVVMNKNYDMQWICDTESEAEKQRDKLVEDDRIEFGEDTYNEYWISEVRV